MAYTKYTVPANPGNYGNTRTSSAIKYLVYHYTGNRTDQAVSNANYFKNNIVKASSHYFVDDTSVYQSVPDLTTAWAVGGSKYSDCASTGGGTLYGKITNSNSISIEMCSTNEVISEATMINAAALGKELMRTYQIPPANVYRHFDVNGKHCPGWTGWYGSDSSKWSAFQKLLSADSEVSADSSAAASASPVSTAPSSSRLKMASTIPAVQTWLNTYYRTGLVIDGIYGSKTKAALVKAWQTEDGSLTIDGSFGSKSKSAAASHNIKKGTSGIFVTIWQAYLVCRGYNPGGIDGIFGIGCHTATVAFQKANGLTADGIAGSNTWYRALH